MVLKATGAIVEITYTDIANVNCCAFDAIFLTFLVLCESFFETTA